MRFEEAFCCGADVSELDAEHDLDSLIAKMTREKLYKALRGAIVQYGAPCKHIKGVLDSKTSLACEQPTIVFITLLLNSCANSSPLLEHQPYSRYLVSLPEDGNCSRAQRHSTGGPGPDRLLHLLPSRRSQSYPPNHNRTVASTNEVQGAR